MGGVSRLDGAGTGRRAGGVGGGGSPAEVQETPPRPEEAETGEAERSQDQTCRHRTDFSRSAKVYGLTPSKGCSRVLRCKVLWNREVLKVLRWYHHQPRGYKDHPARVG